MGQEKKRRNEKRETEKREVVFSSDAATSASILYACLHA